MEKTKKLFGYIVILVAVLSLFFSGVAMQTVSAFAADMRPSVEQKGAPKVVEGTATYEVEVVDENGEVVRDGEGNPVMEEVSVDKALKLTPISEVGAGKETSKMSVEEKAAEDAKLSKMTEDEQSEYFETKKELAQAKQDAADLVQALKDDNFEKVEQVFGKEVLEAMDKAAKDASDAAGSEIDFDRSVMSVTDIVKADLGDMLKRYMEKTHKPVQITFAVKADVVLFKSKTTGQWKSLKIVDGSSASNAAPLNASGNETTTVEMDEPEGVLVFQEVSADAEKIMQAKADAAKEKEDGKTRCCTDCGEKCPFCSFLCKDGKCYCWTMYLAIALAVVLLILVIALIIVKSKAKKAADIQEPEEEEEAPIRRPEENQGEDQDDQQNGRDNNDPNKRA